MFDKYFQDQFDHSLAEIETHRKTTTITSSLFENFISQDKGQDIQA